MHPVIVELLDSVKLLFRGFKSLFEFYILRLERRILLFAVDYRENELRVLNQKTADSYYPFGHFSSPSTTAGHNGSNNRKEWSAAEWVSVLIALLCITTGDIEMTERIGILKSVVEGPRWAALPKFLRDACFSYDLEILNMEVDKGWVRETVRFKVEGSESNLNRLKKAIETGIEQYNT